MLVVMAVSLVMAPRLRTNVQPAWVFGMGVEVRSTVGTDAQGAGEQFTALVVSFSRLENLAWRRRMAGKAIRHPLGRTLGGGRR